MSCCDAASGESLPAATASQSVLQVCLPGAGGSGRPSLCKSLRLADAEVLSASISFKDPQLQAIGGAGSSRPTLRTDSIFYSEEERRWDFYQSGVSLHDWISLCQGCAVVNSRLAHTQNGVVLSQSMDCKAEVSDAEAIVIAGDNAVSSSAACTNQSRVKKRASSVCEVGPSLRQRVSSIRSNPKNGREVLYICSGQFL